jgi:hypothetical protein
MRVLRLAIPVLGAMLIAVGLLTMSAQAIFNGSTTFSDYSGVIIDSNEEVSLTNQGTWKAGGAIAAAGTSPASPVAMTSANPSPLAAMAIAKGNWYYRVDTNVIAGTTPAGMTFKVELYRWSPTATDYSLVGTLYVKAQNTPSAGEKARVYFDLGSSAPAPSESFMVLVSRVS